MSNSCPLFNNDDQFKYTIIKVFDAHGSLINKYEGYLFISYFDSINGHITFEKKDSSKFDLLIKTGSVSIEYCKY